MKGGEGERGEKKRRREASREEVRGRGRYTVLGYGWLRL